MIISGRTFGAMNGASSFQGVLVLSLVQRKGRSNSRPNITNYSVVLFRRLVGI